MNELEFTFFIFSSIFLTVLIKFLINFTRKCREFPPGPWGLPVLGYLPWVGKQPYKTFVRLGKKYGNVFSVTINGDTMVVLNDWSSIKENLGGQPKVFRGRVHSFMIKAVGNTQGLGFSEGSLWKTKRNTSIQILRNIGMGKKSMESKAMDIVQDILDTLSQADGQVLQMESAIFGPILKVNWKLISGDDIDSCSVDIKEFEKLMLEVFKFQGTNHMVNLFPFLRFVPPDGLGFWQLMRLNKLLLSYLKQLIDDHEAKHSNGQLDDYIDYYLSEIKKRQSKTNKLEPPFNHEHLKWVIWSLFTAAVDTTHSTAMWGLLYLALFPHVQKRAQDELDKVIGRHRLPTMSDMADLPYLEALVMETHRFASIVPLSLPHRTSEDAVISGYKIPKGTTCMQNIHAVHFDPRLWDRPEVFSPERFIDQNNRAKSPPYLIPFSIGPRMCIGQSIADMELKLIFSCVLHHFTLKVPPGQPPLTLDTIEGLAVNPKPYSLLIQKRIS